MLYLIIAVCIINITLWIVFLVKFKKLFSTDSIIEKTRNQLNQLIKDIDKSADRDIFLAEETSKRLQNAVQEAEKKMNLFAEASERLRDMIAEADRINKLSNKGNSIFQETKPISNKKAVNKRQINSYIKNQADIDPNAAYEIKKDSQGDLFESLDENVEIKIRSQEIKVTEDGAAFREVPVVNTKLYDETPKSTAVYENGIQERKDSLTSKVQKLFNEGFSNEEIASKLACSITEVDFIIDMNN